MFGPALPLFPPPNASRSAFYEWSLVGLRRVITSGHEVLGNRVILLRHNLLVILGRDPHYR